jgi:hypothetical protein
MERARGSPDAFDFILASDARTIRFVPPEVNRLEDVSAPPQEGNVLIEAVSLLVQRQRETETWVNERLWQAEQRAVETDRRYATLESRLASIEAHLSRLVTDIEPAADDERVARLRDQLAGLRARSVDDTVATRPISELFHLPETAPARPSPAPYVIENRATPAPPPVVEARPARTVAAPTVESHPAPAPAAPTVVTHTTTTTTVPVATTTNVGFMDLLGPTPGDRAGVILIALGGVAVLYALLTQLRF